MAAMGVVTHNPARRGFTFIELLAVVLIIAVMLSAAVTSVVAGTKATRMRNAVRSVWKLSGYARTMALLRQHPVVVTYSEVWEGDDFVQSKIEVTEGADTSSDAPKMSTDIARSIYDREAEIPELESDEEEAESDENVVAEGTDDEAQEFPGVRVRVELLGEDGKPFDETENKKAISVFSNVDYLHRRKQTIVDDTEKTEGTGARASGAKDESEQESREPVSIVFETNGRCVPHRILIWRDKQDESEAVVLEVDRFGAIKNPDDEEDDR